MKWIARTSFLVLLSTLVPGCSLGQQGGTGEQTHAHAPESPDHDHAEHHAHAGHDLPATAGTGYTVADVHFMQMMIPHHGQALRMADLAPGRDAGPEILNLAVRIDISQRDEIKFMEQWLRERNQAVPTEEQALAMHMPGMVTPEQFAQLEAARGPAFDRLFLTFMIDHHLGALDMVDELFTSPGAAQDPDIFRFATDVGADQLDEIGLMERLLERFETSAQGEPR